MKKALTALALALACNAGAWAVTPIAPGPDSEVVETLGAITRSRPASVLATPSGDPTQAAGRARDAITLARQSGDARYWGRAQAALAPWWDKADAPAAMLVLQATVQQGRHEFAPARSNLERALAREPLQAQGWLTLAALERLAARYEPALRACDGVQRAGQSLYATACRLETRSMQGQHGAARQGYQELLAHSTGPGLRSWIWSLLAESEERAGQDSAADVAYRSSLELENDLYTATAYSDLLLRRGDFQLALATLKPLPLTDAVLLRQAAALRALGDPRWSALRSDLREREAALRQRGDDMQLHGRELALVALWLDDDAARALQLAQSNLELQREPLDWWVALQAARRSGNGQAERDLLARVAVAGLKDARLATGASGRRGERR